MPMIIDCDAVIIGAGPAGISAAISLQKANISNVVLEKKAFPRGKTCGGLVTDKTLKATMDLLDAERFEDISRAFCDSGKVVELHYKEERLTRSETSKLFSFVKRDRFDAYLAGIYKKMDGYLYENAVDYQIDFNKKLIHLGSGEDIKYDNLIVADGVFSNTVKKIGYPQTHLGFCVETFLPKELFTKKTEYSDEVRIYLGVVKNGYAWVFPSGDDVCIGLGGVYSGKVNYTQSLNSFLERFNIDKKDYRIKGAFVPYGEVVDQKGGREDIVLVGDAGGFVDPIYGEGLYFAITGGCEAANALLSYKKDTSSKGFKSLFWENMQPYVEIIKKGKRLQKYFFSDFVQKRFVGKVKGKNDFVAYYCDNQIADYNYPYNKLGKLYSDYKKERKEK